jgi:Na+/glutamate symporter
MDDEAISVSNDADEDIGALGPIFVHIALVVQIVVHAVAAVYAHMDSDYLAASSLTISAVSHNLVVTPAAMAGVHRKVCCTCSNRSMA